MNLKLKIAVKENKFEMSCKCGCFGFMFRRRRDAGRRSQSSIPSRTSQRQARQNNRQGVRAQTLIQNHPIQIITKYDLCDFIVRINTLLFLMCDSQLKIRQTCLIFLTNSSIIVQSV